MAITDSSSSYYTFCTTTSSATGWYSAYTSDTSDTRRTSISQERLNELLQKEAAYDEMMAERREIEGASIRSGRMIAI